MEASEGGGAGSRSRDCELALNESCAKAFQDTANENDKLTSAAKRPETPTDSPLV